MGSRCAVNPSYGLESLRSELGDVSAKCDDLEDEVESISDKLDESGGEVKIKYKTRGLAFHNVSHH
jgi:hypothetical protein